MCRAYSHRPRDNRSPYRLVAAEVQARVLRPGRAGADVAAGRPARTGAFLGALFAHACGGGGRALAGNAWLASGAARLAGDYAAWLGGPRRWCAAPM